MYRSAPCCTQIKPSLERKRSSAMFRLSAPAQTKIAKCHFGNVDADQMETGVLDQLGPVLHARFIEHCAVGPARAATVGIFGKSKCVNDDIFKGLTDKVLDAPAHGGAQVFSGDIGAVEKQHLVGSGVQHKVDRQAAKA
ncbi:hypothetical protein [Pseudomonas sp.]|uniref:hypothetical protein n=1 Tax=Pseudomonas sp. TaxID=306 RepID=UPI003FD6EDC9